MSHKQRLSSIFISLAAISLACLVVSVLHAQNPDCKWKKNDGDSATCAVTKNSFNCVDDCRANTVPDHLCKSGRKYSGSTIYGLTMVEAPTGDLSDGTEDVQCSLPVTCQKQTLSQHACPTTGTLLCNATTNPNDRCYQCYKYEGNYDESWPSSKTRPCPPGTP